MKVSKYRRTKFWGKIIEKKNIGLVSCTRKVNSNGECVIKGGVDYA